MRRPRRGISPVALSACQLLVASVFLAITLGIVGAPVSPHTPMKSQG
jgi:hypothetical protein